MTIRSFQQQFTENKECSVEDVWKNIKVKIRELQETFVKVKEHQNIK